MGSASEQISIHAPREGSDRRGKQCLLVPQPPFLSTLPARGATTFTACPQAGIAFLSTLPARGATGTP